MNPSFSQTKWLRIADPGYPDNAVHPAAPSFKSHVIVPKRVSRWDKVWWAIATQRVCDGWG